MPNNAQPYQEKIPTPKQDMQRQPQTTQHDPGIMPPQRAPMPRQSQQGQRDDGESNQKQSTRNGADARSDASESIQSQQQSQQPKRADGDDERGLQGQKGFENEGEGNKTAGRNYDEQTEKFVKSGGVEPAAKEAQRAYEGAEGKDLREAERRGREG
jgi:hypothetical protein